MLCSLCTGFLCGHIFNTCSIAVAGTTCHIFALKCLATPNKAFIDNIFTPFGLVNLAMMVEANFVGAALDSYPIYLITAFGIKSLLPCSTALV
ncbi:hypothetical protein B0O99DRAFT_637956 [Bisporella sp. PMI_857]|nr:hypothetical protein B0O99DRAFT_637956 [Bisporella sp. PMI_857]